MATFLGFDGRKAMADTMMRRAVYIDLSLGPALN
jgi:hypothetical protein